MAEQPRAQVSDLQLPVEIQPAARPVDTFVAPQTPTRLAAPAAPNPNQNLGRLAQILSGVNANLQPLINENEKKQAAQGALTMSERLANTQGTFLGAVKTGQLMSGLNPWQQVGAESIMSTVAANDFEKTLSDRYHSEGWINQSDITKQTQQHLSDYINLFTQAGIKPETFTAKALPSMYAAISNMQTYHTAQRAAVREKQAVDLGQSTLVQAVDKWRKNISDGVYKTPEEKQAGFAKEMGPVADALTTLYNGGANMANVTEKTFDTVITYAKSMENAKDGIELLNYAKTALKGNSGALLVDTGDNRVELLKAEHELNQADLAERRKKAAEAKDLREQVAADWASQMQKDHDAGKRITDIGNYQPTYKQGEDLYGIELTPELKNHLNTLKDNLNKPQTDAELTSKTVKEADVLTYPNKYQPDELRSMLNNNEITADTYTKAITAQSALKSLPYGEDKAGSVVSDAIGLLALPSSYMKADPKTPTDILLPNGQVMSAAQYVNQQKLDSVQRVRTQINDWVVGVQKATGASPAPDAYEAKIQDVAKREQERLHKLFGDYGANITQMQRARNEQIQHMRDHQVQQKHVDIHQTNLPPLRQSQPAQDQTQVRWAAAQKDPRFTRLTPEQKIKLRQRITGN